MATYNGGKDGGKYLRMQLDSIVGQTEDGFEVVVCDDCSTDDTWAILNEYAKSDSRFRLFRNESNLGFVKNFERAASLCQGELVALADQDDIWMPTHLETLKNAIGDKSLACGDMVLIDAEGKRLSEHPSSYLQCIDYLPEGDLEKAYSMSYFFGCVFGQSIMVRKELLDRALPIPEGFPFHDYWLALFSCFYGGMNYTYEVVTQYRRYSENHSWTSTVRQNRTKHFLWHIVRGKDLTNRQCYIGPLMERLPDMTDEQRAFIEQMNTYFNRIGTLGGRLRNALFELRHFREIYRCRHGLALQSLEDLFAALSKAVRH